MKLNLKRESPNLALVAAPLIYLATIYNKLPSEVPTHFDLQGNANGWSAKWSLWLMPGCMALLFYLLFKILPLIDPKQKLKNGVGKYERIKFVVLLFITALACFTLYLAQQEGAAQLGKFMFAVIGLFFAALGNFFPSLKPNYFIGIRTPWALENETVWRKTHQVGGRIWVAGGILIAISAFFINNDLALETFFITAIIMMTILPFAYSFILWKKLKNQPN